MRLVVLPPAVLMQFSTIGNVERDAKKRVHHHVPKRGKPRTSDDFHRGQDIGHFC